MQPDRLPEFVEGRNYRELHPVTEGHKTWRFVTTRGLRVPIRQMANLVSGVVLFHDATGKVWGHLDRFGLYIEEGYAWNGCSPKKWIWPLGWCGTPDFEATILASCVHDFLYQFARTEHFPLHRSDVDALFYHCVAMAGAPRVAGTYHAAVVKYGSWAGQPDEGAYSTLR